MAEGLLFVLDVNVTVDRWLLNSLDREQVCSVLLAELLKI